MREQLAGLLEAIASAEKFDNAKYAQFQAALKADDRDPVVVEAGNTLIEYCNAMTSRTLLPRSPMVRNSAEIKQLREELMLFARAIRAGLRDYTSLKDLRVTLASQGTGI